MLGAKKRLELWCHQPALVSCCWCDFKKLWPKASLGRKGLIWLVLPVQGISLRKVKLEFKARTWRQELWDECYLLACWLADSHVHSCLASIFIHPGTTSPRNDALNSGLGQPASINNQDSPLQICPHTKLILFFSGHSRLSQKNTDRGGTFLRKRFHTVRTLYEATL